MRVKCLGQQLSLSERAPKKRLDQVVVERGVNGGRRDQVVCRFAHNCTDRRGKWIFRKTRDISLALRFRTAGVQGLLTLATLCCLWQSLTAV